MKRLIIGFFAAILLATAVTGCHTVRGAEQDIESAGEGIKNAAE